VVVGGGEVGARKVRNLVRAGAQVTLVSPEATPQLAAMAEEGAIEWIRERFRQDHLGGAVLAVAATADEVVNRSVATVAERDGILLCDASSAQRSRLIFGALHEMSDATVAVFTDGVAPSRSARIRDRIATHLTSMPRPGTGRPSPAAPLGGEGSSLILVAHGSRDPRWRSSLEELLASVRGVSNEDEIRLAFLQFTSPTLPEVVDRGVKGGKERFLILPLFMASAGHVEKDVLPLLRDLEGRYPGVSFQVLTPVGEDPVFHQLVRDVAARAFDPVDPT
jgi:NAD(P)-dependent dehydrogenase (short-subunit alcohol dehydrogenase family)